MDAKFEPRFLCPYFPPKPGVKFFLLSFLITGRMYNIKKLVLSAHIITGFIFRTNGARIVQDRPTQDN